MHPNNSKRDILKTFKGVTLVTLVTLITLEVENKTLTVDDVTTFTYTTVQQTIFELSAKSCSSMRRSFSFKFTKQKRFDLRQMF